MKEDNENIKKSRLTKKLKKDLKIMKTVRDQIIKDIENHPLNVTKRHEEEIRAIRHTIRYIEWFHTERYTIKDICTAGERLERAYTEARTGYENTIAEEDAEILSFENIKESNRLIDKLLVLDEVFQKFN